MWITVLFKSTKNCGISASKSSALNFTWIFSNLYIVNIVLVFHRLSKKSVLPAYCFGANSQSQGFAQPWV